MTQTAPTTDTAETPMERIEALTRDYATWRERLAETVTTLQGQIEALTRAAAPDIRHLVREVAQAHDELRAEVEAHPELWTRRRTVVIQGVRVGMTKGKGKIEWDDPAQVVRLIRRHFPDQADTLVRVKEEPIRPALAELSVAELRRIGCHVTDADDQVVIKPTDTSVDKLVAALLRDAERIEQEGA